MVREGFTAKNPFLPSQSVLKERALLPDIAIRDLFCKSSTRLSRRDNNESCFWTTTIFNHGIWIWRRTYHRIKARERCQLYDYSSWQQHSRSGTGRTCCTSCPEVLLSFAYKPKVSGAAKWLRGLRSDEAAQVCAKAKYQVMLVGMIQQH